MEIYQLKTFVTVAREGSITRTAELLFLSQPAISSHIKALEDEIGLTLFERNSRGMMLTPQGAQLLGAAERIVAQAHDWLAEARRIKGQHHGKVRLGLNRGVNAAIVSRLLTRLSEACPDVNVELIYGSSADIVQALRQRHIDAGFYIDGGDDDADFVRVKVASIAVFLAAPRGWFTTFDTVDWSTLATMPWLCAANNTCCGRAAERLFQMHHFRPQKSLNVEQEHVTRTLIAGGVGVGLLHADTAQIAQQNGEIDVIGPAVDQLQLNFAVLQQREHEPLLQTVAACLHEQTV